MRATSPNFFSKDHYPRKFDDQFFHSLVTHFAAHFAGPQSHFQNALRRAVSDNTERDAFTKLIEQVDQQMTKPDGVEPPYVTQWSFLKNYLDLLLKRNPQSIQNLLGLVQSTVHNWTEMSQKTCDRAECLDLIRACKRQYPSINSNETLTFSQFVGLALLHDLDDPLDYPTERTSVLLVLSYGGGRAVELVAQRIPGPADWVVPHWFRLGLVHMGQNLELCMAINAAMHQVQPGIAIRWWLEANKLGHTWHDAIDEVRSITVAAACLAKALAENVTPESRPLLDDTRAVSGNLTVNGQQWMCGPVTGLTGKIEGAAQTNLRVIFFSKDCELDEKNRAKSLAHGKPALEWVSTLEDTYRGMLRYSELLLAAKRKVVATWDKHFIEVETHAVFQQKTQAAIESDPAQFAIDPPALELPTTPTLDNIFESDGSLRSPYRRADFKPHFVVRQPIWYCDLEIASEPWTTATQDKEPSVDRRSAHPWRQITRQQLLACALSDNERWRHVALLSSPGLGKTMNLKYLEASVNRHREGRDWLLAIYMTMSSFDRLDSKPVKVEDLIKFEVEQRLRDATPIDQIRDEEFAFSSLHLYKSGRILFLIDDFQANFSNNRLTWLQKLLNPELGKGDSPCKVWVAGRHYSLSQSRDQLTRRCNDWQFMRLGPLDEPEVRQLLQTGPTLQSLAVTRKKHK